LIWKSKESGADCAKFQHFEANSIVSDFGFKNLHKIETHQSKWDKSVVEIYDQYHTKRDWDFELIEECKKADIHFMTTPYNLEAINFFKDHVHAFKVGSGDITYGPLLKQIAKVGKPVFLATGASEISEVHQAVELFKSVPLCIMQCNTNYTGNLDNFNYVNLNVLKSFELKYPNALLGFSDHTPGHSAVLGAVTLGAVVVEKHFTDDNLRIGPDHSFALNPVTWKAMVDATRELEMSIGDGNKRVEDNELNAAVVQRRAIRLIRDLDPGDIITKNKIEFLRPCEPHDISPMNIDAIIGKKINKRKKKGESIRWTDLNC